MLDQAGQSDRRRTRTEDLSKSREQATGAWITGPLESIPLDQARQRTSRRIGPPWSRPGWLAAARPVTGNSTGDPKASTSLLPEIENMRSLHPAGRPECQGRGREGKVDDAIDWLQTGYSMARHVAEGPS